MTEQAATRPQSSVTRDIREAASIPLNSELGGGLTHCRAVGKQSALPERFAKDR